MTNQETRRDVFKQTLRREVSAGGKPLRLCAKYLCRQIVCATFYDGGWLTAAMLLTLMMETYGGDDTV